MIKKLKKYKYKIIMGIILIFLIYKYFNREYFESDPIPLDENSKFEIIELQEFYDIMKKDSKITDVQDKKDLLIQFNKIQKVFNIYKDNIPALNKNKQVLAKFYEFLDLKVIKSLE